jgi:predicted KAP-like P-loop ATPase
MISNDSPITDPKDDQFGIDNFAKAIAKAIEKLAVPDGTVIALTGPWGSGKSSAVNLMRYYLKAIEENEELKTIVFNPWWYSDEPALTRAFFQHLYAGLGSQRSEKRSILLILRRLRHYVYFVLNFTKRFEQVKIFFAGLATTEGALAT